MQVGQVQISSCDSWVIENYCQSWYCPVSGNLYYLVLPALFLGLSTMQYIVCTYSVSGTLTIHLLCVWDGEVVGLLLQLGQVQRPRLLPDHFTSIQVLTCSWMALDWAIYGNFKWNHNMIRLFETCWHNQHSFERSFQLVLVFILVLPKLNTWTTYRNENLPKWFPFKMTHRMSRASKKIHERYKTFPKAQRTRGLSSYYKFLHKS